MIGITHRFCAKYLHRSAPSSCPRDLAICIDCMIYRIIPNCQTYLLLRFPTFWDENPITIDETLVVLVPFDPQAVKMLGRGSSTTRCLGWLSFPPAWAFLHPTHALTHIFGGLSDFVSFLARASAFSPRLFGTRLNKPVMYGALQVGNSVAFLRK